MSKKLSRTPLLSSTGVFTVSQSKLKCWRDCRRKYYYRHVLRIKRRHPPNPLLRGNIIHSMIEARINGQDPWTPWKEAQKTYAKLFREQRDEYGDLPGDIEALMSGYFRWFDHDPLSYLQVQVGKTKSRAEHYFEVPLTESIILQGTIDSLAHSRDKRFWMVEHKSHNQLPQGDIKYSDIQSALYCWVIPQVGLPQPDGVMWNYIRMKRPTVPHLLKPKKDQPAEMSRAQIDTTWSVYEAALKAAKLDPDDYDDMRKKLEGKESEFYVRQALPVNKHIIANLVDEAQTTAREIKRKAGVDKTRSIDNKCSWCEFYLICQAHLRGLDDKSILKHQYISEEKDRYADKKEALTPA